MRFQDMINLEEKSRHELVSLTDVPRDHRFISYRKLQIEADENFKSLLNQLTLMHLSAQVQNSTIQICS